VKPVFIFTLALLLAAGAFYLSQSRSTMGTGEFVAGTPLGTINERGIETSLSNNVKVFGSFVSAESCTFDAERNLILTMNNGVSPDVMKNDGYVSLINPDGSVHTAKWIGASRGGLILDQPLGTAIANNRLYTVDIDTVRSFDLATGAPLTSVAINGATLLNGIAVTEDGTVYSSNTLSPERIYRTTADGNSSVFIDGPPLAAPNGVAIDNEGNVVVVNFGDNAVLTFDTEGELIKTERAAESGSDGIVILHDDTKYISSVRYGSVSRIRPGQEAEIIASGIPNAASMCYDSVQNQLVVPMNINNALAFIPLD